MAGNVVEEIFKINTDTAEIIKNLQRAKGVYQELTEAQVAQVAELKQLEEAEKRLTAARDRSTNPTKYIAINKALDDNLKKLGAVKEAVDKFTVSNEKAKVEANALGVSIGNAFKGTQVNAVKSAAGQFNALNNSVNQVARELPAFAVSANIGFLAISNNLPILFDALQKVNAENAELVKQGQKGPSVFKQLAGSILSFNTLLTIGVTLLTVYGGKVLEAISNAFSASDAFKLEAESLKILDDQIQDSVKSQEDLVKATSNVNKEIIKDRGLISEAEAKFLNVVDKNNDKYLDIEKKRRKAIADAVTVQLQAGDKTLSITTKVNNGVIEIEDKKNKKIIRLDADAKNVLGKYSGFYRQTLFTQEEKAFNDKLEAINKQNERELRELRNLNSAEMEQIALSETDKDKLRRRFSDQEFIRQRSAANEIRQLLIDTDESERNREEQTALFKRDKAVKEIELANETEKRKLEIARVNYIQRVAIEKLQTKDQIQLNENLIKLNADYQKEVRRIKADNISEKEQKDLLLQIERNYLFELGEIDKKFRKETEEKIAADFKTTVEARQTIAKDNAEFEIFLLEDKVRREERLNKLGSKQNIAELRKLIIERKVALIQANADEEKAQTDNAVKKLAIQNKAEIEIKKLRTKGYEDEKDLRKKSFQQNLQYLADLIKATIDAVQQIIALKVKELDTQIGLQQKRVDQAHAIADRGNAEQLELEQKRLDDLNKKREKYVRQQQALAAVELIANTAIAVSKAAAQGGVAAGVTIAAALIALVAGLATARSIAGQAAYYEGGFTGEGNPTEVSTTMGGKKAGRNYTWHKGEFVMNHVRTREYRDIFEDIHAGKVDLREWKEKASAFDQSVNYRAFTTNKDVQPNNQVVNIIDLKGLETQMHEVNMGIRNIKFGLNVDHNGFTQFQRSLMKRQDFIRNAAKL